MDDTQTLVIRDVPKEDVEQVVSDLKRLGATKVETVVQNSGNQVTITAVFPA